MPFRSEAQRKKLIQLEKEGKLKPGTVAKWQSETKGKLPERVQPKKIKSIEDLRSVAKTKIK